MSAAPERSILEQMKTREVNVSVQATVQFRPYETIKVTVGLTEPFEMVEGEDATERRKAAISELFKDARSAMMSKLAVLAEKMKATE